MSTHRLTTRAQYQAHMKSRPASGLSVRKYCVKHNLDPHKFFYYQKKYGSPPSSLSSSGFLKAEVKSSPSDSSTQIPVKISDDRIDPVWLGHFVQSVWGLR